MSLSYQAESDGYLQVLVANESDKDVWFDDVQVSVEPALIVQEQHYDPFGLLLVGIEKEGDPQHPYLYNQSSEKQPDVQGEGYAFETPLRNYDPQLGRFHRVDILAQDFASLSPYQYGANNPIGFSDPTGASMEWIREEYSSWRRGGGIGNGWNQVADLVGRPDMSWDRGLASQQAGYLPGYGVGSKDYTGPLGNPDYTVGPLSPATYRLAMALYQMAPQGTTTYGNIQAGTWTERYKDWTVNGKSDGSTLISRSFTPQQPGRTSQSPSGGSLDAAAGLLLSGWGVAGAEPTPAGEVVMALGTTAAIAYYGPDLAAKMQREIDGILQKASGPNGFLYALTVNNTGTYVDVRGNRVTLNAGDVWKYGETVNGFSRYTPSELATMVPGGVTMLPIYFGNQVEIKVQEKVMIYSTISIMGLCRPEIKYLDKYYESSIVSVFIN